MATMTGALAFLAVFVYAMHATHTTQAIAFEWKPGFTHLCERMSRRIHRCPVYTRLGPLSVPRT